MGISVPLSGDLTVTLRETYLMAYLLTHSLVDADRDRHGAVLSVVAPSE